MNNIVNYMYKNIEDKAILIAEYAEYKSGKFEVTNLKSSDIIKFSNYLNEQDKKEYYSKKIGILMNNSIGFVNAFYSIILNNKIVVAINSKVTLSELNHIIEVNNLDLIITEAEFEKIIMQSNIKYMINYNDINLDIYSEKFTLKKICPSFDDIMLISYTSGTSGNFSKPVEITYKNVSFVSEEYVKIYKIKNNYKCITVLPLWHNYAMFACLTSAIVAGSCITIMKEWDLDLFLEINERLKPQIFPGSPYMYIDIINNVENLYRLDNLKICDCGGDSLPIECINKFEKVTGAIITEGYGLTETTSLTHFNYSASERKVGSLGKCVSNTECMILDLNGKEVSNNSWGLLWIKGPMVFKGYVGVDINDTPNLTVDGWFNTNDVVKRDDDGFYFFAGRYTDLQTLDDSDCQFRELENKLYKFDGIKRVHVKSNKNEIGNFPYFDIIAELKNGYSIQNLYDYINSNLKSFVINDVKIVEKLPTTGTGKIKRNKINDILLNENN